MPGGNIYISSLAISHHQLKILPMDINLLLALAVNQRAFRFVFHRLEIFSNLRICDLKTRAVMRIIFSFSLHN